LLAEHGKTGIAIVEKPNGVSSYDWPIKGFRHTFSVPLSALRRYKHNTQVAAGTAFTDLGEKPEDEGVYWTRERIAAAAPKPTQRSLGHTASDRDRDWE